MEDLCNEFSKLEVVEAADMPSDVGFGGISYMCILILYAMYMPSRVEAKPDDAPLEDAAAEKKPGSPLGRRLTQILRSLPSKKGKTKKPSSSSTSSSSPSPAPEEPAREDETQEQQIHPAAATTATANNTASTAPIVQATA